MPDAMKLHSTDFTLYALFCLSRLSLPVDSGALGRLSGRTPTETAGDLLQLGHSGQVASNPAGGMRLTMLGLVRAAQLEPMVARASSTGTPRMLQARKIKPLVAAKRRTDAENAPAKLSA